jgi:hypothetical protein
MNEEQLNDIELYMKTIGIKGYVSTFLECTIYQIGDSELCISHNYAIDDKTGKVFNSLGEICEFYKLPFLPDNVRTKEDLIEYKRVIVLKP